MNGAGLNRYNNNHEKIAKNLKNKYDCYICNESDYKLKEVYHKDKDKKNNEIKNLVVLCKNCHKKVHKEEININFVPYKCGFGVKVAWDASSVKEWFDSTSPLKLKQIPSDIAMKFRKRYVRGFIIPGANNIYIGAFIGDLLFGVLGFSNPEFGNYDLLMKADTTPTEWDKSTDLLLFCLRSKECKQILEKKFNREINTVYSMCFTNHDTIQRYKKHAELINKKQVQGGYNLGYLFKTGDICSLKEAKAQFIQKSWKK